jgi:hypothetical protein
MRAKNLAPLAAVLLAVFVTVCPARAQVNDVTPADIQRLQDGIYDASQDVSAARSRDAALASRLQGELDDLRDEVVYLKVKLRKKEPVARGEYSDLRDRIDSVRSRTRPAPPPPPPPPPPVASAPSRAADVAFTDVRVGTEFQARLQSSLSSETAKVEDRVDATTVNDIRDGDRIAVPAGSILRGIVKSVNKAGRLDRRGNLTLTFDRLTIGDRTYDIRATLVEAVRADEKSDVAKVGVGAGVGAIVGAILGGGKGALAGVLIGGGGTIAATEGNDVNLPAGTVLKVRLDSALNLPRD